MSRSLSSNVLSASTKKTMSAVLRSDVIDASGAGSGVVLVHRVRQYPACRIRARLVDRLIRNRAQQQLTACAEHVAKFRVTVDEQPIVSNALQHIGGRRIGAHGMEQECRGGSALDPAGGRRPGVGQLRRSA